MQDAVTRGHRCHRAGTAQTRSTPGLCSIPAPQRWHRLQSLVLVGFYLLIPVHDHSARYPQTGYQLTPTQVVRQPDLCLLALQPQQSVPASVCSAPQTRETRSSRAEEAPRLDHPSWTLWVSTSILPREHPSPCGHNKHVRGTKPARIDSLHRINKAIWCLGLVLL